jgi:hypothetical protein
MLGAAEALREQADSVMLDFERASYEPMVASVRAALDDADFEAAWADGRSLNADDAVALALGRPDEALPGLRPN